MTCILYVLNLLLLSCQTIPVNRSVRWWTAANGIKKYEGPSAFYDAKINCERRKDCVNHEILVIAANENKPTEQRPEADLTIITPNVVIDNTTSTYTSIPSNILINNTTRSRKNLTNAKGRIGSAALASLIG
ncbi:hypothetical protein Trydic_g22691 [Trypoxylus dichotomus]